MAFQSVWYYTGLPEEICTTLEKDLVENYDASFEDSGLSGGDVNKQIRNSQNAWVPTGHWISGFLWNYITLANDNNFLYDLKAIDQNSIQYTRYEEGQFYNWHNDAGILTMYKPQSQDTSGDQFLNDQVTVSHEQVRKLSFVLQLSNPDDYEGGNLQLLDENGRNYFAPRKRGTVIIFDSRTQHRVLKVTKGVRKSLVGWVVGPRWK